MRHPHSRTPPLEPESALLSSIAAGDQHAFSELYNRTSSRVMGLVVRVLLDRAQAEEVVQEIFLEIWQHASRFDPTRGSAIGWMLRVAHSRAVDRVRASDAANARDVREGMRALASPPPDSADDLLELKIESQRIERALKTLPPAQREAIELTHLAGYTQSDVAARLDIPLGTVKTRVRDGLQRLRRELDGAA